MREPKTRLIAAICIAAVAIAANLPAQTAVSDGQLKSPDQASSGYENRTATANSDATLEIVPRSGPTPPTETPASSDLTGPPEPELPPVPTSGPPSSMLSNNSLPPPALPYLGVAVQQIESHTTRGHSIDGLEIVNVDPGSPAERAGLRGRGSMSTLGASGATAGALIAPLDIALMPLLKKSGQLGRTGDLIIAIDDRRVVGEADLETALGDSKPGDTIYLTIMRLADNGAHKTIKVPVKLGNPSFQ
jgi:hypothetical protein